MCKRLICLFSFVLALGPAVPMANADLAEGLVAYWPFDDGSGTTAVDVVGGHHGTLVNGPKWTPPGDFKMGTGALKFDGSNDVVSIQPFDVIGGGITLAAWMKPDSFGINDGRVISKATEWFSNDHWWMLSTIASGGDMRLRFRLKTNDGQSVPTLIASSGDLVIGEWHHWAATWDGATMRLYSNTVQAGSMLKGGTAVATDPTVGVAIGSQPPDAFNPGNESHVFLNFDGVIDDVAVWNRALTPEELVTLWNNGAGTAIIKLAKASDPRPSDEATDVPRDAVLSWTPGIFAPPINGHTVYLSENFNDVNDGVGGIAQDANSYAPGRLNFSTTYYWRVDEVNGAPDYTVHQGNVWSFTTEPVGYAIENVTATASSQATSRASENTVNGSGLDDSGLLHGKEGDGNMWLSGMAGPQPTWIEFEFDKVYKLHELWVWNSNGSLEPMIGFGFKDVTIEYSSNDTDYTTLGTTHQFARAPGAPGYAHNTTVDFGGAAAKYVRLTANSNWGGIMPQFGLSEVRFFNIPVHAREPHPDSGATDVDVDVTLGFRAGREAATHNVYLSTDEQAVIDGTAPATAITETSHDPLSLDLAKTYYWRVDEVNEAETPATWQGELWDFTTQEYFIVDDFESYNDLDPGDPNSNRIFFTWLDGYGIATNGSVVGYENPPFCEQTIVHGDKQSMPLAFSNTGGAAYSEAELTLSPPQDWSKHGVKTLSLWFSGDASNTDAQMYVKVNGSKVTYDGDASNLTTTAWQPWNIELTSFGAGLQNVTKLAIGIDGNGATGKLLFDDIRLYPYGRQFITPAEPSNVGLMGHYKLDQDATDSSGRNNHGTLAGNLQWVAGKIDGALSFDGITGVADHVEISTAGISVSAGTVAMWAKLAPDPQGPPTRYFFGHTTIPAWSNRIQLYMDDSDTTLDLGLGDSHNRHKDIIPLATETWYHIALTWDGSSYVVYVDGAAAANGSYTGLDTLNTVADIGNDGRADATGRTEAFNGLLDDVRIYDRVLPQEEIRWLAGRTKPIDKPF